MIFEMSSNTDIAFGISSDKKDPSGGYVLTITAKLSMLDIMMLRKAELRMANGEESVCKPARSKELYFIQDSRHNIWETLWFPYPYSSREEALRVLDLNKANHKVLQNRKFRLLKRIIIEEIENLEDL